MVFELILKQVVFLDTEDALSYYNNLSENLTQKFYQNFLVSLQEIQLHPENYLQVNQSVRRHIIKSFPYKVFYVIEKDKVIVIGVTHVKRSNRFIKARLKNY